VATAADSNTTGVLNNIPYGAYCIQVIHTCYDTSFTPCFSASGTPISVGLSSTASRTIGRTNITVTISNSIATYTINIYNPWAPWLIQYKIIASGECSGIDSAGDTKTIGRPAAVASGVYYLLVVNQQTNEKDTIKLFFK